MSLDELFTALQAAVMRKHPVITDVVIEVANAVEARFQELKEALR